MFLFQFYKYNYAFEKALKKRPLRNETNLPLTLVRNPQTLRELFYSDKVSKEIDDRYFSTQIREPFLKAANEKVFRRFKGGVFLSKDGMSVSKEPWNPSEGGSVSRICKKCLLNFLI